jgi:hypothetical protein
MNIVICLLLLNFISTGLSIILYNNQNFNQNFNHNLNRFALRYVIFKEKKLVKILKNIIHKIEINYNKSFASIAEGVSIYTELSEDEKTLIEAIISLSY